MRLHKFAFQRKMNLISLSCCRRDSVIESSLVLLHSLPCGIATSLCDYFTLWGFCTLQRKGLLSGFVPLVLVAPTSSLSRAHLHTAGLLFPSQLLVTCLLHWLCREGERAPLLFSPLSSGSSIDEEAGMSDQSVTSGTRTWCQRACGYVTYWTRLMLGNV